MKLGDHPKWSWPWPWASSATNPSPPDDAELIRVKPIAGPTQKTESIEITCKHDKCTWSASYWGGHVENFRKLLENQKGKKIAEVREVEINDDFTPV